MVDDSLHTHQGFEDFFHSFFFKETCQFYVLICFCFCVFEPAFDDGVNDENDS